MSETYSGYSTSNSSKNINIHQKKSKFRLLNIISSTLDMMINENKDLPNYRLLLHSQKKLVFSGISLPNFSLNDYIKRIITYTKIEENTLIISLIYIDKLCQLNQLILIPYNIHRLLCSALICAIKFNEDKTFGMSYYAEIFGVSTYELNVLEYKFIEMIDFNFYINENQFVQYKNYLLKLKKMK